MIQAQIQAAGGDPDELEMEDDDYDLDEIVEMEMLEELGIRLFLSLFL